MNASIIATAALALASAINATCCSSLSSSLASKVFYPETTSYNASMEGYWTLQATFDDPTCIVKPANAEDVSTAVQILVADSCKFAIKGGGHTPWAGASSISQGVTIDMTGIADVVASTDRSVVSIGAGARWGPIYETLQSQGLMVAGGRDSDVGIGGLVLGGGYSWFTSTMGFVCDGVVNIELVTATGEIVNVNATSYPDLFVGLKGGSNNFGVVTRYDLKSFDFGEMWGGLKIYPNTTGDAQIEAFVNFTDHAYVDTHANLINYWTYDQSTGEDIVFNVMDYTLPVANPPIYDEINAIPGIMSDTTRFANVSSYTDELSSTTQRNRNIFLTMSFKNDAAMYKKAVDISNSHLKPLRDTPGLIWSLLFQPIPRIVSDVSIKTGGNVMGLDLEPDNLILYLLYLTWTDPADDAFLNDAAYACLNEIEETSIAGGTFSSYIYLNYAGEFQDPLGGYGTISVDKLKALSQKYDPNGVFQKLVPGGYKVANAKPTTT